MEILLSCRELPTWSRILNSAILRLYLVFQLKINKLKNSLTLIISVCDPVMGDNGHYVYLQTPNFNSPKILSTVLPIWCRFTEIRSCRLQTCSRRTLSNWGTFKVDTALLQLAPSKTDVIWILQRIDRNASGHRRILSAGGQQDPCIGCANCRGDEWNREGAERGASQLLH